MHPRRVFARSHHVTSSKDGPDRRSRSERCRQHRVNPTTPDIHHLVPDLENKLAVLCATLNPERSFHPTHCASPFPSPACSSPGVSIADREPHRNTCISIAPCSFRFFELSLPSMSIGSCESYIHPRPASPFLSHHEYRSIGRPMHCTPTLCDTGLILVPSRGDSLAISPHGYLAFLIRHSPFWHALRPQKSHSSPEICIPPSARISHPVPPDHVVTCNFAWIVLRAPVLQETGL